MTRKFVKLVLRSYKYMDRDIVTPFGENKSLLQHTVHGKVITVCNGDISVIVILLNICVYLK